MWILGDDKVSPYFDGGKAKKMYRCYGLKTDKYNSMFSSFAPNGEEILEEQTNNVSDRFLYNYVMGNYKGLNAHSLEEDWFPTLSSDVFLSYSHDDLELAKGIAGFLRERIGLEVFMDNDVWKSADILLKAIDEKERRKTGVDSYNYQSRNLSTSHVHAMLTSAIMKAIDNTEIVIFLNTNNSLEKIPTPDGTLQEYTLSPWIYEELMIASVIRRKSKYIQKSSLFDGELEIIQESSRDIYHKIPSIAQMLSENDIDKWAKNYRSGLEKNAINVLYEMERKREIGNHRYIG